MDIVPSSAVVRVLRRARVILLVVPLAAGLACAGARPTPEQMASADYGAYPTNYQEIAKSWFADRLKEPYSAMYEFQAPTKGWSTKAPILGGGIDQFGYLVTVRVNAKNGFGGYTGYETYQFLIRNGAIVKEFAAARR